MTNVVAIMLISLDGYNADANDGVAEVSHREAVGGYPYYATAPGPCSVHPNRGVEEEQG
jgi:hypothetical protein